MAELAPKPQAVCATALHTPGRAQLEYLANVLIEIDNAGFIRAIHPATLSAYAERRAFYEGENALTQLPPSAVLIPGLVDLHVHAPQFPQLGMALDVPLQDWLQLHSFPLEARYADEAFAHQVYQQLVRTLLANGTTTALYFATIHVPATKILADICLSLGQRALIGRVAMDHPAQCPDYYRDASAAEAEAGTRQIIDYVRALPGNEAGRVLPVITPRFIPACTDDLLYRLGALAKQSGCHVQTHASESIWEHNHVSERCGQTDSAALQAFGLLGRHSVLAHGVFLTDHDLDIVADAGAAIAHCPLSNAYFGDGIFPLRRVLDRQVHVGLGTDVAGGASPSVLEAARHALICARHLENSATAGPARVSATEAFYLATAGGGVALNLPIGQFKAGYYFDALAISPAASGSNLSLNPTDSATDILQKILYLATRADIAKLWVAGRAVTWQG